MRTCVLNMCKCTKIVVTYQATSVRKKYLTGYSIKWPTIDSNPELVDYTKLVRQLVSNPELQAKYETVYDKNQANVFLFLSMTQGYCQWYFTVYPVRYFLSALYLLH